MKINLSNGYFIEVDTLNYTLKKEFTGKKKDGSAKKSERVCGYYGKLEQAIDKFVKLNQIDEMDGMCLNLQHYVDLVKEINDRAVQEIKRVLEEKQ